MTVEQLALYNATTMSHHTTIAAIATGRGQAALAIVRVSGPEAVDVAARCFRGKDLREVPSHTVHVGFLETMEGETLDQVVATVFRAPRSATGEDVVELSCHGGDYAPRLVLEALLNAGAAMAAPGAFTQRAFLNGKLDLAQAEAVADLIHASSERAHLVSLDQLRGRYSHDLEALRQDLLDLAALVELELDFAEEDVEFAERERLEKTLRRADGLLTALLGTYTLGEKVRDGVRVALAGKPNAGKSTLLNALVGFDRAIVSATPGTTRDEVEAEAEIEGLRFRFVDTAGLRETADAIEQEGVRRARATLQRADAVLYLYDLQEGLGQAEAALVHDLTERAPVLLVGNKADLAQDDGPTFDGVAAHLRLSAQRALTDAAAIRPLVDTLVETTASGLSSEVSHVVTNARHRQHLAAARDAVHKAQTQLAAGASGDLLALDLRVALDEIGQITGAVTNEDVLSAIFSRFCIGK